MSKQTATDFLKQKGMLTEGHTEFVISGAFGVLLLNDLLNEFAAMHQYASPGWIKASERLPGMNKVVEWMNRDGGDIPLGKNTFLDQYKKSARILVGIIGRTHQRLREIKTITNKLNNMTLFKRWSKWEDLSIGQCNCQFYLLQARRRSDGKVQFRVAESKTSYNCPNIKLEDIAKVQPQLS